MTTDCPEWWGKVLESYRGGGARAEKRGRAGAGKGGGGAGGSRESRFAGPGLRGGSGVLPAGPPPPGTALHGERLGRHTPEWSCRTPARHLKTKHVFKKFKLGGREEGGQGWREEEKWGGGGEEWGDVKKAGEIQTICRIWGELMGKRDEKHSTSADSW